MLGALTGATLTYEFDTRSGSNFVQNSVRFSVDHIPSAPKL